MPNIFDTPALAKPHKALTPKCADILGEVIAVIGNTVQPNKPVKIPIKLSL